MTGKNRIFGLDLLRAVAISFVLLAHAPLFFFDQSVFGNELRSLTGTLGVEIFLTLSGFLIYSRSYDLLNSPAPSGYLRFLLKRWTRTLPLFYLVLGVFVVQSHYQEYWIPPLLPFVTFTQNFFVGGVARYGNWFGLAWTLSLEEWFYLIFAALLFLTRTWTKSRRFAVLIALLLVVPNVLKLCYLHWEPAGTFDDGARRVIVLRFDAILWGCLAFEAYRRSQEFFDKKAKLLIAAVLVFLFTLLKLAPIANYESQDLFARSGFLMLIPILMAGLVIGCVSLKPPFRAFERVIRWISTRSYSLYLVHLPLWFLIGKFFPLTPSVVFGLQFPAAMIVSELTYRQVEKRFMKFARPGGAG